MLKFRNVLSHTMIAKCRNAPSSRYLQSFWIKVDAYLDGLLTAGAARIEKRLLRVELADTPGTKYMTTSENTPVFLCSTAAWTDKVGEIGLFIDKPLQITDLLFISLIRDCGLLAETVSLMI